MNKKIVAIGCSFILIFSIIFVYNFTGLHKKLGQDTQLTTASGSTFTAERGWFVVRNDDVMILQEPSRELMVALTENQEPTAQEAVSAAWKKVEPNFSRTILYAIQDSAQDGWDEKVQFTYNTNTQEDRFVFAQARRHGKAWYIALVDGTKAAVERRMAGIQMIDTSFKAPGLQEESFLNKKAHFFNAARLKEFAQFIAISRKLCSVPGAAVSIVQNGKIVFEKGFGILQLGKKTAVTPQTLFMVGSITKPLTTFMMAKLIDEGRFTWDTPVTDLMPDFALGDAAITKQLLMKHLVSASTGMPRQDVEFIFNYDRATPKSRIEEMRTMKPTTGFGETFQYSNGMVSAAGYIAAHAIDTTMELGAAYDMAMQSRVFDPIGMAATTFDFSKVKKVDHAIPHRKNLKNDSISLAIDQERWVQSLRPAGGLWSNVHDIAEYMIVELNNGIDGEGERIISEKNVLMRRIPQIKKTDKSSYGLALVVEKDHGIVVIGHNGQTMGFSSIMEFLPEQNIGFVLLSNAGDADIFTEAVKRKFMELVFDGKSLAANMVNVGIEQQNKIVAKNLATIVFKPAADWLKQFEGTYTHDTLGQIVIRKTADGAQLDAGVWKSNIGQKKESDGVLKLILTDVPFAGVKLLPQEINGTMQLILDMGQHKYIFERKTI